MTDDIDWSVYPKPRLLKALLGAAQRTGGRVAIWQETQAERLYVLVAFQLVERCRLTEALPPGFIYNRFAAPGDECTFLPADLLFEYRGEHLVAPTEGDSAQALHFFQALREVLCSGAEGHYYCAPPSPVGDESRASFVARVEQAVATIAQGDLQKVVVARTQTEPLSASLDLVALFLGLCQRPEQFVALLSTPEEGTWIGCSPELLLAVDDASLRTLSLAGTIRTDHDWTAKEYQEQELVNQYIRGIFLDLGITELQETAIDNMNIGILRHLKSAFMLKLPSAQYTASSYARILERLHPTPALCGTPKQTALRFIAAIEPFDRQLYGGYWGPCNLFSRDIRLYVNIRCMQVFASSVRLFLGAGITRSSSPEAEWDETCLKGQTLLDVL